MLYIFLLKQNIKIININLFILTYLDFKDCGNWMYRKSSSFAMS